MKSDHQFLVTIYHPSRHLSSSRCNSIVEPFLYVDIIPVVHFVVMSAYLHLILWSDITTVKINLYLCDTKVDN